MHVTQTGTRKWPPWVAYRTAVIVNVTVTVTNTVTVMFTVIVTVIVTVICYCDLLLLLL